jgi:cytochrome c
MSSLELNKAFAAVLTAGITFMLAGQVGKVLVHGERPHESAIKIGEVAAPAGGAPAAAAGPEPIAGLLANASVENGQGIVQKQCAACHSLNEGGKNGVGPNLYGVVGAGHGHVEGFNYSAVLKSKPGPWSYDALNEWLYKPSAYAPGTRMGYAGLANTQQRADVIAYLRSISPKAPPLPPAGAAAAPTAAPATAAVAPAATPAAAPAAAETAKVGPLMASADPEKGGALFRRQCAVCHTVNEGGKNGVGPNLYDVVGKPHGHVEGFNYSAVLKGKPGPWSYEELSAWLLAPAQYAPGTRMGFVGLKDVQDRANVIAYLRSLSPSPQPLP